MAAVSSAAAIDVDVDVDDEVVAVGAGVPRDPAAAAPPALAALAVGALLDEARLAPKPGLVDSRGSGAHDDLDLALMCRSARALGPHFAAMAEAGRAAFPHAGLALREALGQLGREAEATMMAVTGGINTHRGAIWALGLLIGAAAFEARRVPGDAADAAEPDAGPGTTAATIAATAGRIAGLPDRHAPQHTGHKGERACRSFGVGGARGEARAGFPHVVTRGLPELRRSRARGDSETAARLNALLAIIASLDDTCVLSRGGRPALARLQHGAAAVLAAGGTATLAGRRGLRELDSLALSLGASPGGAADLLAATLLLDRIEHAAAPRTH